MTQTRSYKVTTQILRGSLDDNTKFLEAITTMGAL
jgi:hypothetical protein